MLGIRLFQASDAIWPSNANLGPEGEEKWYRPVCCISPRRRVPGKTACLPCLSIQSGVQYSDSYKEGPYWQPCAPRAARLHRALPGNAQPADVLCCRQAEWDRDIKRVEEFLRQPPLQEVQLVHFLLRRKQGAGRQL